jgi:hypothetical protein
MYVESKKERNRQDPLAFWGETVVTFPISTTSRSGAYILTHSCHQFPKQPNNPLFQHCFPRNYHVLFLQKDLFDYPV